MKKLALLTVVLFCASLTYGGVVAGNNTKLFWADGFGDPNDSYAAGNPGDTVFVTLHVNNNQWSAIRSGRIEAWLEDGTVVDALVWNFEVLPYAHLKDYRNGGGYVPTDAAPDPMLFDLGFGGSNVYIYTGGPGAGVAPLPTTFDYIGTYGADPGGQLLGFYVPIKATATAGSSELLSVRVTGLAAWSSSIAWSEELSDFVNTDWAMEIAVLPEPATMGLLAVGGIAALLRRRK